MVKGTLIQCTFAATVPSPSTRASSFALAVSTGDFDSCKLVYYIYTFRHASHALSTVNSRPTVTNTITDNMFIFSHVVKTCQWQFCLLLSASGTLGAPTSQIKTAPVDLANPSATVTNELSTNATTSPNTTSHAIILQQSLTQGTHKRKGCFPRESKVLTCVYTVSNKFLFSHPPL